MYNILVWKYLTIPANSESVTGIQYWMSSTVISNARYLIFLKIVWYEHDSDTDTDIITALFKTLHYCSGEHIYGPNESMWGIQPGTLTT